MESNYPIKVVITRGAIFLQIFWQLGKLGTLNKRDGHEVKSSRHVLKQRKTRLIKTRFNYSAR